MSQGDQEFDIRSILKSEGPRKGAENEEPHSRHVVVMDMGRIIFTSMCVLLIGAAIFVAGYVAGRNQAVPPAADTSAIESSADGLVAAVPADEENPPSEAAPEGQEEANPAPADGATEQELDNPPLEPSQAEQTSEGASSFSE
ncbi:MAG: hypothetical protein HYR55_13625 [Acidobacteria bacterium]|nr:hypothetical protein [Acidobacteriota bacterium]MBI3656901.1 hypothetical protein [Acidobacteriota bacterium]